MENDLISRKKLIDDLEAWRKILDRRVSRFDDMVIHTLPVVFDLVNEQKTVKAEPKWISVKERLPEKNGMYLAHLVHSYSNKDEYSCVTDCFFNLNARPKWAIEGRLYKVTHWMPLPSVEGLHDD